MTAPAAGREMAAPARSFLFLQGPLSPLYARIADAVGAAGHRVCRVNLCIGDRMHWRRPDAVDFRGRPDGFAAFVARLLADRAVSDIVLHGECRVYHRIAAEEGRRRGARIFVTELGYLRPDWMTVDRDGTGGGSIFPREPDAIRQLARQCGPVDLTRRFETRFTWVAVPDVVYNLSNSLLWFLYPHYERHTIDWPPLEYAAWLWRLVTERQRNSRAERVVADLAAGGRPYFLVAMQLEGDFQVRARSPFRGQAEALEVVLASFAAHAPRDAMLVLKTHPLDNGLRPWRPLIQRLAGRHAMGDRILLVDGGRLDAMLPVSRGLVTINSSAGLEAILGGIPVKVLAPAIYDVPGLVHGGDLDTFWSRPEAPDPGLAADFVRALAGTVQVRGTIYSPAGLDEAVRSMTHALLTDRPGCIAGLREPGILPS
ncbi:MAG: capsular biosynthesis protein [Hyphomicrobiaceae bacterium]|nr:capsular biosynthesis protein [Hyphomicrobiaceae bacterium]